MLVTKREKTEKWLRNDGWCISIAWKWTPGWRTGCQGQLYGEITADANFTYEATYGGALQRVMEDRRRNGIA
jgi:hypothetical protein